MNDDKQKLIELYQKNSKHSNYQVMPRVLENIISNNQININSRFEFERLDFLLNNLNFEKKKVLDIGGNTGFFTFESISAGAKSVDYIEGNAYHANFVEFASGMLNQEINVYNKYCDFQSDLPSPSYDIVLLFNVIHHFGDDYGDSSVSIKNAKEKIVESINYFVDKTEYMVLQFGFCWKGNRDLLLFDNGTKTEMIELVSNAIAGKWTIENIGIAEEKEGVTTYNPLSLDNEKRMDSLGEFRNRPIFILKAIK